MSEELTEDEQRKAELLNQIANAPQVAGMSIGELIEKQLVTDRRMAMTLVHAALEATMVDLLNHVYAGDVMASHKILAILRVSLTKLGYAQYVKDKLGAEEFEEKYGKNADVLCVNGEFGFLDDMELYDEYVEYETAHNWFLDEEDAEKES